MFTIISHLALTISCSLSFYIYYGKYGAPKQVLNRRMTKFRNMIRTFTNEKHEQENADDMNLPDMSNFLDIENENTTDTIVLETSVTR